MTGRRALIALGANLGNAETTLDAALAALNASPGIRVMKTSGFFSTSPVDSSGPDYVNAVAALDTDLTPEALLERLLAIETEYGRVRPAGIVNAPRTLDLDLLLFEGEVRSTPRLTIPHPRMTGRLFVLVPWLDVEPDAYLPDGRTVAEAAEAVRAADPSQHIRRISQPRIS